MGCQRGVLASQGQQGTPAWLTHTLQCGPALPQGCCQHALTAMDDARLPIGAGEPDLAMQQLSAHFESRATRLLETSAAAAFWQYCCHQAHKHPQHLGVAAQELLQVVLLLLVNDHPAWGGHQRLGLQFVGAQGGCVGGCGRGCRPM